MDVSEKSVEDVGDKVFLLGRRFEIGFKRKRGVLLLRFAFRRKIFF